MTILLYLALLSSAANAYSPAPRWGQATSLLTSSLFISAGKQDTTGSSYTGANAQSDLLLLPLGVSFNINNPPWSIVSDPTNVTNSHGPAVAWHTLSAFNSSQLLVFGGVPTPVVPLATQPDSAWLLNAFNRRMPQFTEEPASWGGEPIRRIHHTAVTSRSGQVYIIGGEKADDSRIPFSEHYVFDPGAETFSLLPTDDNAAPALTGHGSVILSNGQIFVFGGSATQDTLLPLDTFYIFDTTSNAWSRQTSSSTTLPPPRRGFAYTLLDDTAILIHGGASRDLLESFADGWIYNITTSTWTNIPNLSAIGQRRDHFCVYYGGVVLFGFGYETNAAANTSLILFDPATQSFPTQWNAASPTSATLPIPSQTDTATATSHMFSGTISGTVSPTSTNGSGSGSGGGDNNGGNSNARKKATTIAVGTVVGLLAFVAVGAATVWYIRRHERKRYLEGGVGGVFSPLDGEAGGAPPSAARMVDAPATGGISGAVNTVGAAVGSWAGWVAGGLGLAGAGAGVAAVRDRKERRDMLADEDEEEFGLGAWYGLGDNRSSRSRLRQASGGSTWSLLSVFRPNARRQASAASGMSYGSRAESLLGVGDEKDPYESYMRNVGSSSKRPGLGRRQSSYASVVSSTDNHHYTDPFADPFVASELDIAAPGALLTAAAARPEMLSPITEVSRSSDSGSSANHHTSSASIISPFDSLSRASTFGMSSNSHQNIGSLSPGPSRATQSQPRASSILDMRPPQPDQPMRRSDTWWARFAGKSLLDRRSSRGRNREGAPAPIDFHDPTPLPARLGFEPVQEETASMLAERKSSDGSAKEKAARESRARAYGRMSTHGKSMSSIQTADSAALERMGDVGVMLRGSRQSGSTSTRGSEGTVDEGVRRSWQPEADAEEGHEPEVTMFSSPTEMVPAPAASFNLPGNATPRSTSPPATKPPSAPASIRPPLSTASSGSSGSAGSSSVADRVRAYERRMSQDVTVGAPSKEKDRDRDRERRRSNYGLVPRPSLFVANPTPGAAGRESSG
ncbi:Adagio protein 1-like [Mycena kentingensis (nom. inval.)]|nr:Adagio protein 1-like [Mycena kentingensis (nom. inval.)]